MHRRVATAQAAAEAVPAWLAFRWLAAQGYNAHQPLGRHQAADKKRAERLASALVEGLGGQLHAPQPPGLDRDPAWQAFTEAATAVGREHQWVLLWHVWRRQWGAKDHDRRGQMQALYLTLQDMACQQRANDRGWRPETGWPRKKGRG
jgi:hypothetical protein